MDEKSLRRFGPASPARYGTQRNPRQNGNLASKEYKAKIRNTMSAIFTHALRHDLANHNPISCGGSVIGRGGKRGSGAGVRLLGKFAAEREVVLFEPLQVVNLLEKLSLRDHLLVLLTAVQIS